MYPSQLSQMQPAIKKSPKKALFYWFSGTLLVVATVTVLYFRQNIADFVVVQQFQPSAQLNSVLGNAYLSDTGRFYVYASQTKIVDKQEFNNYCGSLQNEKSIVLGCYSPTTKRIAVYDVTDDRLRGVRETTTAHEMLHAVWDRLDRTEQSRLENLLNEQAQNITDQRLQNLFTQYRLAEPSVMPNELHSIIGTEVADLLPELEQHYARYFSDRKKLVAESKRYESVFVELETNQTNIVNELDILAVSINDRSTKYENKLSALNADIDSFNLWADSGRVSESEFNRRRNDLLAKIEALEVDRLSINEDIDQYNRLKDELDSLNMLAEDLNRSMNSSIKPLGETPSL